jgi:hypothetical protein
MATDNTLPSDIETHLTTLAVSATPLTIEDQESYEQALTQLALCQQMRRRITKYFADLRQPVTLAGKRLTAAKDAQIARLTPVEGNLNKAILEYEDRHVKIDAQDAEALSALSLASGVPASPLVPTVVTPNGYHRRETVSAEVVDLAALISAVSDGTAPIEALRPHQPALNRLAREQGELFAVPGCKRVVKSTVVSR